MPEYFELSFIFRKIKNNSKLNNEMLSRLGLQPGENKIDMFPEKVIIVSLYDVENVNFIEINVGFPDVKFHKGSVNEEIEPFISFIKFCFIQDDCLLYALGSYEMNSYWLGSVKSLNDIHNNIIDKFPLVAKREKDGTPKIIINKDAQNIF